MTDRPVFDPSAFGSGKVTPAPVERDTTQFNPQAINAKMQEKKQQLIDLRTAPLGPIPTWSMSRLFDFEECPYKVYLSKVEKMPDPSGPAAERGTMIHEHIENYINGNHSDVIKEMHGFQKLIDQLRDGYNAGEVQLEGDWAVTRYWTPAEWNDEDAWGRFKLDAFHMESPTSAIVYDWKTGRKFGNEMKHNQQGMGYAISAFALYPELEFIKVKFVYLDKNDTLEGSYTRAQAELLRPGLTTRADKFTTCTDFEPKPSFHACRWCPHAKIQEGRDEPACRYADSHTL